MLNLILFIVLIMAIVSKSIIKDGSHNKKLNVSLAVAVILPAVIALPGALETIVYCIMYITLFMKTNYIKMIGWIKSNKLKSFVIIVLIFFVLCMNACHLLDEIEHVNLDFRGNVYYE